MSTDIIARGLALAADPLPQPVSGHWYHAVPYVPLTTGLAPGSNSIRLVPFPLYRPISVKALGGRITTGASGNCQLAIYAADPTSGAPTGTAKCSTANISTASAQQISASVTQVTLPAGIYWAAVNQDNATVVYQALNGPSPVTSALIGSATLANINAASGSAQLCYSFAQTFGTWPDLTGQTFTEVTSATYAALQYQAA